MALSVDQLLAEIATQQGNLSAVARALGVTRRAVQKRVATNTRLADALEDARETMVDEAVNVLRDKLVAGDLTAAIYVTKTLGKGRGYVERSEHTGTDGTPIGIRIHAIDYRAAIAPLAPRSVDDRDPPGEGEGGVHG